MKFAPGVETLALAARAVAAVRWQGHSADDALGSAEGRADRAAVRAIALGTMRWLIRLEPALNGLMPRPLHQSPPELAALLVTALHQIVYSRGAPEVSVHLAVDAARALRQPRSAGFVNAVLRRFMRERDALLAAVDESRATRTAHPPWMAQAFAAAWPAQVDTLLDAGNAHPPMTLRVDPAQASAAHYVGELAAAGHAANVLDWRPGALQLAVPMAVASLPGFRDGRVSVQDAAAQLAVPLLQLAPGQRVLDACAAPGGKTAHLLELEPALDSLLAVDIDAARLALVRRGLERQQRAGRAEYRVADLRDPAALRDRALFDRILLDAPCSATGVIRRHPDIKLLRRADDIRGMTLAQGTILANLFARLAPGGELLYCTCSVLPDENERVIAAFRDATPEARNLPWPESVPPPPGAITLRHGTQLLPGGPAGTDGFYYARLVRRTSTG